MKPGRPMDEAYAQESLPLVEKGCRNLIAHIETVKRSGVKPVVCINAFSSDTEAEHELIRRIAAEHGARCAVSAHWERGGDGAVELATEVVAACGEPNHFEFLYELEMPFRESVELIAREIYGASGVGWSEAARRKAAVIDADLTLVDFGVCMSKTHLSLSYNPDFKGRPTGWELPISDILVYKGAGFIVPVVGDIKLLPGTGSNPGFRRIDIDTETGKVTGLF